MNKTTESFLNKVAWPLLLLLLTPAAILIGSKLLAGDWFTWLKGIPSWAYTSFFLFICLLLLVGWVVRRIKALKGRNAPSLPLLFSIPRWGYTIVGTLNHKNVIWRVQIPSPAPWDTLTKSKAQSSRVDIELPPHCPKCDTELEEAETFFGNNKWKCIRCGFSCKNELNFYCEALRAKKLAKSWWEKESNV